MSEVGDLDAKRKAKAPKCEICGSVAHEFEAQCPRIYAITKEPDGGITYHIEGYDPEPDAAA